MIDNSTSATYKRIQRVDLKIPSKVSPEARDLITKVSFSVSASLDAWDKLTMFSSCSNMMPKNDYPSLR